MLNGLDLFSGIGGIAIALAPWVRPIAYCEIEHNPTCVLLQAMAEGRIGVAPVWDDIRKLDGRPFRGAVDIIYGGFPCQGLSVAGLKKGLEDERSGLFFEIVRLADEIRPDFIFLENVPGIRKTGPVSVVVEELAALGFSCKWDVISAREVGAQFQGNRWFLLGASNRTRLPQPGCIKIPDSEYPRQPRLPALSSLQDQIRLEPNPELCRSFDGIPPRTHRVKGLGNAVLPLQARTAFARLIGIDLTANKP